MSIASEYIIQRISPGEEADGWQTIGYRLVSDNISSDEDGLNYTYTDSNLSPSSIGGDGGYLYRIGAKTSDAISDAPDSPGVAGYTVATNLLQTPLPSGPGTVSGTDTSIVAGGEVDVVLSYSLYSGANPAGTVLTVKNFNPDVVQPTITTVTINSSGGAILPVAGVSVGSGKIIVQDSAGDEVTLRCGVYAVGVSSTGNVVQGATYGTSNMPGFTFFIDGPSVTPVVISYNTSGSTLPANLMGNMSSGSVTIDPGSQSVFVPFTVPPDNKVAAMRTLVVTLTPAEGGNQAFMNVQDNGTPSVLLNGAANNAVIPLDPQGGVSSLTKIALSASYSGDLLSTTLTWNPNDFIMWPSDQIGQVGLNDLASISDPGGYGASYDEYNGLESFTWQGAFAPTDVYGQDLDGSSNWDNTNVQYSANVLTFATPEASEESGGTYKNAAGTADGVQILWGSKVVTGIVAGSVVVGQGVSLSAVWVGPGTAYDNSTSFVWNPTGRVVAGYNVSNETGSIVPYTGNAVSPLQTNQSTHFYWVSGPSTVNVNCDWEFGSNLYSASTKFTLITPKSKLTLRITGSVDVTGSVLHFGSTSPGQALGMSLTGTATMPVTTSGTVAVYQFGTFAGIRQDQQGTRQFLAYANAADGGEPQSDSFPGLNHASAGQVATASYDDSPYSSFFGYQYAALYQSFVDDLMFRPDGSDTIWVPLRTAPWYWVGVITSGANNFSLTGGDKTEDAFVNGTVLASEPSWTSVITTPFAWFPTH